MDVVELWWLSLAIAAVVVMVVAILLGLILAAAIRIDRHAAEIWGVGKQIAGNTVSIWMLEQTNNSVAQIASAARSMESTAASMDEKLGVLAGTGGSE